jgi:hypothetical protein
VTKMGMMPRRRIGYAKRFDIWNQITGELVIRNVDAAEVVATYQTSLTADEVIVGVAEQHHLDADNFRVTAHMAISG